MNNVLVTGGKGQLASCMKDITENTKGYNFIYADIDKLDITIGNDVEAFFIKNSITHCVNCAAYTAVDKAESNKAMAELINVEGAKNLALSCNRHKAILIHISTDFVFDGKQTKLYTEKNREIPLGVYGETKLLGEKEVVKILEEHFIIRTSWLYSEHGHNFLKTMLKLGKEKDELRVVSDQIGTPTYAGDLAELIVDMVTANQTLYGTYHYSNEGVASWYDFAKAIFDESKVEIVLLPISTTDYYKTPAERPKFSVLDKSKIKRELDIKIPYWRDSMKKCLNRL